MSDEFPQDYPAHETGNAAVVERFRSMQTQIRESTSNLLRTAGIFLTREGMRIASSLVVEGDLTATGATAIGGTLDVTGDAVFSGNLAVPNGSIDNDALASPVVPTRFRNIATGFTAGSTSLTTAVSQTITVPAGMTKCVVIAQGYYYIENNSGFATFMFGRVVINGTAGDQSRAWTENFQAISDTAASTALLTDLTPGATFTVNTQTSIQPATTAVAGNAASISGVLLWLR